MTADAVRLAAFQPTPYDDIQVGETYCVAERMIRRYEEDADDRYRIKVDRPQEDATLRPVLIVEKWEGPGTARLPNGQPTTERFVLAEARERIDCGPPFHPYTVRQGRYSVQRPEWQTTVQPGVRVVYSSFDILGLWAPVAEQELSDRRRPARRLATVRRLERDWPELFDSEGDGSVTVNVSALAVLMDELDGLRGRAAEFDEASVMVDERRTA